MGAALSALQERRFRRALLGHTVITMPPPTMRQDYASGISGRAH